MTFNYDRIKNFHDKRLLALNVNYFNTFVGKDAAGMKAMQREDFYITDLPLGLVKKNRDEWFGVNAEFTSHTSDTVCTAISFEGFNIRRGGDNNYSVTILENHIQFKMTVDYPDQSGQWLPPNLKAGDTAAMIMCSIIWWDKNGKAFKDLEYGRVPWKDFNLDAFLTGPGVPSNAVSGFERVLNGMADDSDDEMFMGKEILPAPWSKPKKRSIFTRAGRWVINLFRL